MANLLQKLIFRSGIYVIIASADIGSLKSLHTFFAKYLDHMLVNLNKVVWSEPYKILCFLTKKKMVNKFWQSVDVIFEDVSVTETIVWCSNSNSKTIIFQVFQKLRHSDTCNQVKSCIKHGRPDQSQRKLTVALKQDGLTYKIKEKLKDKIIKSTKQITFSIIDINIFIHRFWLILKK